MALYRFKEMKNVITINHINIIGGVEEFIYQLAKNYERDFTVYYRTADPDQLRRLRKQCKVVQFTGKEKIVCDRAFYDYGVNTFIENIEAKEHIEVIHADYKVLKIPPHLHKKITKYICVSNLIKEHFLAVAPEVDPDMVEVVYNPLELSDEERRPALLIGSFTRLTGEKGGNRIKELADRLNKAGINYLWFVFFDYSDFIKNKNVIFCQQRLEGITNIMASLDFVAQVSDSEGWSYTEQQAKMLGIPMIHTPYPAFFEMGTRDEDICLEFDLSNIDEVVEKLKNVKKKFRKSEWKQPANKWNQLLLKGGDIKEKGKEYIMKIRALMDYYDTYEGKDVKRGDVYETTEERTRLIEDRKYAEIIAEAEKKDETKKRGRKKNAVSEASDQRD